MILTIANVTLSWSPSLYEVYVISCESKKTGRVSTHIGIAIKATKRLNDHINGRVKATRGRHITLLGYTIPMTHSEALKLEIKLKKLSGQQKREWIKQNLTSNQVVVK